MGRKPARRTLPQPARGARRRTRDTPRNRRRGCIVTFAALCRSVRADLGQDYRYAHCVRVARLADRLAQAHGEDAPAARLAGMLHDLARLYSSEQLLAECAARALPVDAFERSAPVVLHARLSAELARERYGVTDERILSGIRAHTLAAPNMSRFDMVVYLADGLEPGRAFAEREAYERLALADLEGAMRVVLASTSAYLRGRGLAVAPVTESAVKWFAARGAGAPLREEGGMEVASA